MKFELVILHKGIGIRKPFIKTQTIGSIDALHKTLLALEKSKYQNVVSMQVIH